MAKKNSAEAVDNVLEGTQKSENAPVKLGPTVKYHVFQNTDRGLMGRKGIFNTSEEAEDMVKRLKDVYEDREYVVQPGY